MRMFNLIRLEDASGVSGSGVVAEGVEFTDGKVAMTWLTKTSSIGIYDSIDHVSQIHGHEGRTQVLYRDFK